MFFPLKKVAVSLLGLRFNKPIISLPRSKRTMTWHEFEPLRASDGHKRSSPGHWASYPSTVPLRRSSEASRFEVPMAVAAQLHGSTAAAAAYQRLPAFRVPPSSGRWPQNPLGGSPKLCSSISGVGMKPFGFGAKVSTKCANENTQVEELNLRSNQTEELVEADEDVSSQKRSAKIHDFCLGIPFGSLLFCMGLLGYIFSKSTVSLVLGVAPGLATLFLGTLSLKFWRSGRSSFLFILGQAAISALLAWKYSHAYLLTNRILPWGFYASLSTAMACFYAYVLLAGGNPPPKKLAAAPSSS